VIITLTTDFGERDGFVGAMKGVISRLCPAAQIVDVSHHVPRHDIAHGAWVLATACREFPVGTIHVAVVDPGVGGERLEVVVAAGGHTFVGPDNGLFQHVAAWGVEGTWAITSTAFRFPEAAPTFHGRDVFAPTAAALAGGLPPEAAGPATCLAGTLPWLGGGAPTGHLGRAGHVVHIDHFGNAITDLAPTRGLRAVRCAGAEVALRRSYRDVAIGAPLAYIGSAGTVELALREGDAAAHWRLARGAVVEAVLADER
jgi:S-adenosyl-L-methionine hydrolase (adenosine-forming)